MDFSVVIVNNMFFLYPVILGASEESLKKLIETDLLRMIIRNLNAVYYKLKIFCELQFNIKISNIIVRIYTDHAAAGLLAVYAVRC